MCRRLNRVSTGLYRVYAIMREKKVSHYEYRVKNKLVDEVIRNRNILELKINVLEAGLLWGITDIDAAEKLAKKEKITVEELQGKYGEQVSSKPNPTIQESDYPENPEKRFNNIVEINNVFIKDHTAGNEIRGLDIVKMMNDLDEENQKLKDESKSHGWLITQFDIRLGRLHKENNNLKQLIIRGADKDESAKDILNIANELKLIKKGEY